MRKKPYLPAPLEKELSQLGIALSNTTRIHIIEALSTGPKDVKGIRNTVRKIQKNLGIKGQILQPAISQHLKILRKNNWK